MVYVQAIKKRAILRQIIEGAIPSTTLVSVALLGFQTSISSASLLKGRLMISTSGSGQSASYEIGMQGKEFTQDNILAVSEEFFGIYEWALNYSAANGVPLTDDGTADSSRAILKAMHDSDRLQTVNRKGMDFTLLNWPQIGVTTE